MIDEELDVQQQRLEALALKRKLLAELLKADSGSIDQKDEKIAKKGEKDGEDDDAVPAAIREEAVVNHDGSLTSFLFGAVGNVFGGGKASDGPQRGADHATSKGKGGDEGNAAASPSFELRPLELTGLDVAGRYHYRHRMSKAAGRSSKAKAAVWSSFGRPLALPEVAPFPGASRRRQRVAGNGSQAEGHLLALLPHRRRRSGNAAEDAFGGAAFSVLAAASSSSSLGEKRPTSFSSLQAPLSTERHGSPLLSMVTAVGRRVVLATATDRRLLALTSIAVAVNGSRIGSTRDQGQEGHDSLTAAIIEACVTASKDDFREASIPSFGSPTALHFLPGGASGPAPTTGGDASSSSVPFLSPNLIKGSFLVGTEDGLLLLYTYVPTVNGTGSLALTRVVYPPQPRLRASDNDSQGNDDDDGTAGSHPDVTITAISDFGSSSTTVSLLEHSLASTAATTATGSGKVAFAFGNGHVRFFSHSLGQAKVEVSRTVCKVKEMLAGVGLDASSSSSANGTFTVTALSNDPLTPSWLWVGLSNGLVLLLHPNNVLSPGGGGGFMGTGCPMLRIFKQLQLQLQPQQQEATLHPSTASISFATAPGLLVASNAKGLLFINTSLLHDSGYEHEDEGGEDKPTGARGVATFLPFSVPTPKGADVSVSAAFHPRYEGLTLLYRRQYEGEEEVEAQSYRVHPRMLGIRVGASSTAGDGRDGDDAARRARAQPGGIVGGLLRGIVSWFVGPLLAYQEQEKQQQNGETATATSASAGAGGPAIFGWARLAVLAGGILLYLYLRKKSSRRTSTGKKRKVSFKQQQRAQLPASLRGYDDGEDQEEEEEDEEEGEENEDSSSSSAGFFNPFGDGNDRNGAASPSMPLSLRLMKGFTWLARIVGGRGVLGGALLFMGIEVAGFNSGNNTSGRLGGGKKTLAGKQLARELGLPESFINGSGLIRQPGKAGDDDEDAAGGIGGLAGAFGSEEQDFDPLRRAARAVGFDSADAAASSAAAREALRRRRKAPTLHRAPELVVPPASSSSLAGHGKAHAWGKPPAVAAGGSREAMQSLPKGLGAMLQRQVAAAAAAKSRGADDDDDDVNNDDDGLFGSGLLDPLGRFSKSKLDSMDAAFERLAARARRKRDKQTEALLRAKEKQAMGQEAEAQETFDDAMAAAEEDTSDEDDALAARAGVVSGASRADDDEDGDDDDDDDGFVAGLPPQPMPAAYTSAAHHNGSAVTGPGRWAQLAETLASQVPPDAQLDDLLQHQHHQQHHHHYAPFPVTPGAAAAASQGLFGGEGADEDASLAAAIATAAVRMQGPPQ